jgi:hypothetical protein
VRVPLLCQQESFPLLSPPANTSNRRIETLDTDEFTRRMLNKQVLKAAIIRTDGQ